VRLGVCKFVILQLYVKKHKLTYLALGKFVK
jgi:hypothetical protein